MNKAPCGINGFRAKRALERVAADPRVEEIEGEGCDHGCVFVHLTEGPWWYDLGSGPQKSANVASVAELKFAMASIHTMGAARPAPTSAALITQDEFDAIPMFGGKA